MAHDNIEIEVKYPLPPALYKKVRARLQKIAKFDKVTHQLDTYYTPAHRNFMAEKYPFEWLSIRRRGNKNILNYKSWYPHHGKTHTHCDEYDILLDKPEIMEKLFKALDVKKLVAINKTRETYLIDDELECALDTVKELGCFIEIETMKNLGSVAKARARIIEFATELGIAPGSEDLRGYPYLLMEKKGMIKKSKLPK